MMAPTAWPWLRAFQRITGPSRGVARIASTLSFAGGYLSAWLVYSIAAAGAQLLVSRAGWFSHQPALPPTLGAAVLIAAGMFQLTPLKTACLRHCRNPLTFLLARWRNGPMGGYRLGLSHGWFCVGCCWALMATVFAVGLTNLLWMLALTALVFIEQAVPGGDRLSAAAGLALILGGVARIVM
jgi:predicted metal-binding membrane protein